MSATLTLADLFAGCGGLTEGFRGAGFGVVAAVEMDHAAATTYQLNHPEVAFYAQDIRTVSPADVMRKCGIRPGELTVLAACPPCQPFSTQNRKRATDARAHLVFEVLRFAEAMRPRFVFIENIPGFLRRTDIVSAFRESLTQLGYRVPAPAVADAVNYGVPQFRRRAIMLATLLAVEPTVPEPTHAAPDEAYETGKRPWRTVRDAIMDLRPLRAGETSAVDPLHRARRHRHISIARLRHIPRDGGSRDSLPAHLQAACHRRGANLGFRDVYGRMSLDWPAPTLTAGCTNFTKGRFAHPIYDRSITLREAARLQTFPDTYEFFGTYDQISAQIGNAVPVELARVYAEYICGLGHLSQR